MDIKIENLQSYRISKKEINAFLDIVKASIVLSENKGERTANGLFSRGKGFGAFDLLCLKEGEKWMFDVEEDGKRLSGLASLAG